MIRERHFVLTSQAGRRLVGRLGPPDINQDHDDDPAGRTPTKFMRIAARRAVGLAARSAVNVERCLRETDDGGVVIVLSTSVLGSSVYFILWFFLIYSIVGVIVEMLFCLVVDGVLESRTGLLYVPLRPIYGVGGVACELLLHLTREPILLFLSGMLVGSAVEYGAGLFVEKAFGTASWDYSEKRCNVHGRICLQYSVAWVCSPCWWPTASIPCSRGSSACQTANSVRRC
jgi:hypothetical protein